MSNNIQINQKDPFQEAVRSKLHDFEMPVDDALWNGINAGIAKPVKRKVALYWFISGIAASVAIIFTISLAYFSDVPTNNTAFIKKQSAEKAMQNTSKNIQYVADKQCVVPVSKVKEIIESEMPVTEENVSTAQVIRTNSQPEIQIPVETNSQHKTDVIAEYTLNDNFKVENKDSTTLQQPKLLTLETPIPDWEDPVKDKKASGITLLALASSAPGNSSAQSPLNSVSFVGRPRMGIMAAESASTYIFPAEFYENIDYKTPVSAGIGIGIPIHKNLSIETGLTYSYLQTQYHANLIDAQMNLHYIGIPCRLAYKLINRPGWGIYSAFGGAVEKGLWSFYKQDQHFTNSVISTTISKPIEGLQWSVQMSVGAVINLSDKLSAYAEPKLGYYFANEQPSSIRTNSPLNIGFEAGIRWRIKE